jgi:tRNA-splicing endonuclease subunit Sen54
LTIASLLQCEFSILTNLQHVDDPSDMYGSGSTEDGGKFPKRGEKDFEPHRTAHQASVIEASREAMHSAISQPRVHIPKNHVIGIYEPNTGSTVIPHVSGIHFRTMGRVLLGQERLFPEEALYLLERGALDVRWPVDDKNESNESKVASDATSDKKTTAATPHDVYGLPMSLQAAYAVYLGTEHGALTLERYQVYAGLKRSGYIVHRAETWDAIKISSHMSLTTQQSSVERDMWWIELWKRLLTGLSDQTRFKCGPLVTPGLYRSYADIYNALRLTKTYNPQKSLPSLGPVTTETPYRIAYNVYKPNSTFKKSSPGSPDFRISVITARDNRAIPTLSDLDNLWSHTPLNPPDEKKSLNMRLQHGYRNVILAIVDSGIISYLRLADTSFGMHPVYRMAPTRGNKGGRRGRGRGGKGRG